MAKTATKKSKEAKSRPVRPAAKAAPLEPGRIRIEYVPLDEIRTWPRNPKLHDQDTLGQSIDRFGFVQPLLFDESTGQLVAGHGRLENLARRRAEGKDPPSRIERGDEGEWKVPVIRGVSFKSEREAEAYLLADNRMVEAGGWNEKLLGEILGELRGAEQIDGLGWSAKEIQKILDATTEEIVIEREPNPVELLDQYLQNDVRRIILFFEGSKYDEVVASLERLMRANDLENHTDAFMWLLAFYEEKTRKATRAKAST